MNEDQLIGRLLRVIKILEDQRASLDKGSAAYKRQGAMVDDFTAALRTLQAGAGTASAELARLEAQLNNVFSRMEARTKSRPNLNIGDRKNIRVGQDLFSVQQQLEFQAGVEETQRKVNAKRAKARKVMDAADAEAAAPFVAERERRARASGVYVAPTAGETPATTGKTATEKKAEEAARKAAEKAAKDQAKAEADAEKARKKQEDATRKAQEAAAKAAKRVQDAADKQARDAQKVADKQARDAQKAADAQAKAAQKAADAQAKAAQKAADAAAKVAAQQAKDAAKAQAEQAALDARQNLGAYLPGGNKAAQNVYKLAQGIDRKFTPDTIKSVSTEASTNISKINMQYADADGIIKKLTVTVDKFGNVLADTQKRFRPFFDNLRRDIVEVAKWSIAIAVVYGPMQKLNELTQEMIKNEAALADVTIALGNAQKSTTEIFNAAAQVAQLTGESIAGVIEAYNLAYRAAGGAGDSAERFATANKLLADSITLSKLSTLDQAGAIDLLSASLKQAGMSLTQGNELMNSWVAVTKVANVDLETLATGFSVLGDAALSAGLSTGELNAVISVIAESSGQSSKEVANTARAILSGFQSDQSVEALNALGISIVDVTGKSKNFLQIIEEINALRDQGFISPDQYTKLSQVVGGGARRGAAVSTFMNTYNQKSEQIISASENAGPGEAAGALAEKLDTVESAVTRLNNAFTMLAQSLGEQGGLLTVFKDVLNTGAGIVEVFAELTAALGKAGPLLYTALAGVALLGGNNGYGSRAINAIGNVAQDLGGGYMMNKLGLTLPKGQYGPYQAAPTAAIAAAANTRNAVVGTGIMGTNALAIGGAALSVGASAVGNFREGKESQAIGNIVGGAIGAGLGTAVGGPLGTMIGASLGSAIAEGFVNAATDNAVDLNQLGALMVPTGETKTGDEVVDESTKAKKEAEDALAAAIGSDTWMGTFLQNSTKFLANTSMGFLGKKDRFTRADIDVATLEAKKEKGQISEAEYNRVLALLQKSDALRPENVQKAKDEEIQNIYGSSIEQARLAEEKALLADLNKRRVGVAPYRQGKEALVNMGSTGSQFYESFGQQYQKNTGGNQDSFFRDFARVAARVKPEELQLLTEYKDIIAEQDKTLKDATKSEAEHALAMSTKIQTVNAAASAMEKLNQQQLANIQLLQETDMSDLTKAQVNELAAAGKELEKLSMEANMGEGMFNPDEAQAFLASLDPILVKTKEGYMSVKGLSMQWLDEARKSAEETGKILKNIGFQSYDFTAAELDKYIGFGNKDSKMYTDLVGQLKAANPAFKEDRSEEIVISSDKQFKSMNKDWKIVQFLLSEILKTEQKQLDGMYNLPDGATFWIPYQAAKYGLNGTTGGTGTGSGGTSGSEPASSGYNPDNMRKFREADAASMIKKKVLNNALPYDQQAIAMNYDQQADMRNRKPAPNPYAYSGSMNAMDPMTIAMQYANSAKGWTDPHGWYDVPSAQSAIPQAVKPSEMSAKMNINITSTTNLVVDGKKLAQIVKPYLAQDLVKFGTSSAVSNTNVVAT